MTAGQRPFFCIPTKHLSCSFVLQHDSTKPLDPLYEGVLTEIFSATPNWSHGAII